MNNNNDYSLNLNIKNRAMGKITEKSSAEICKLIEDLKLKTRQVKEEKEEEEKKRIEQDLSDVARIVLSHITFDQLFSAAERGYSFYPVMRVKDKSQRCMSVKPKKNRKTRQFNMDISCTALVKEMDKMKLPFNFIRVIKKEISHVPNSNIIEEEGYYISIVW